MKEKLTKAQTTLIAMLLISAIGLSIYVFCWVLFLCSMSSWAYEDMVEKTVRKMVKPEYLIGE